MASPPSRAPAPSSAERPRNRCTRPAFRRRPRSPRRPPPATDSKSHTAASCDHTTAPLRASSAFTIAVTPKGYTRPRSSIGVPRVPGPRCSCVYIRSPRTAKDDQPGPTGLCHIFAGGDADQSVLICTSATRPPLRSRARQQGASPRGTGRRNGDSGLLGSLWLPGAPTGGLSGPGRCHRRLSGGRGGSRSGFARRNLPSGRPLRCTGCADCGFAVAVIYAPACLAKTPGEPRTATVCRSTRRAAYWSCQNPRP